MPDSAIRIEHLTHEFGSARVLDDLGFTVPIGAVFGFLGPNGAGKTTTIRILLGLLEPTLGYAEVLGIDTRRNADRIRSRAGALLEHTGLYERLSAEENLELFGRIWRISPASRVARTKELLAHLGLYDRRTEAVSTWSRGMKQKLAVARALFHRPQILFLDEPTAGLDPVAAAALRDDLHALVAMEGVTVFLTTHNLAEAEKLCSQVGVIRQGKLVALGHPDQLRAQTGAPQVEVVGRGFDERILAIVKARPEVSDGRLQNGRLQIELRDGSDTAPLVGLLVSEGAAVEEVRRGPASLEDVFLTLMEESR